LLLLSVPGLGGFDEGAGLFGQTVQAGNFPALELGNGQICRSSLNL